jgi:hypothetical protein
MLGVVWLAGTVVLVRSPRLHGNERWLAAAGFALNALVLLVSDRTKGDPFYQSLAIGIATIAHLSVTVGIATGVRRAILDEKESVERRVALALEYVARGFVPMCAHCRSVRDAQGRWQTLEAFVAESTAATVSEVLCPDCRAEPAPMSAALSAAV